MSSITQKDIIRLIAKLVTHRMFIKMKMVGALKGVVVGTAGIVELMKLPLIERLLSCCEIWMRACVERSCGSCCRDWYDIAMNAVTTAENRAVSKIRP